MPEATSDERLRKLTPAELSPQQRDLYDSIVNGAQAKGPQLFQFVDEDGRLEGPFNGYLVQPGLGTAMQALGTAVRHETDLTDRAREIAILIVGVGWNSPFEWYAHEAIGRHAGLTDVELDGIRAGDFAALSGVERVVAETTALLVNHGDLDDAAFAAATAVLGEAGVLELLTVVGYYAAIALQMRVLRVTVPES